MDLAPISNQPSGTLCSQLNTTIQKNNDTLYRAQGSTNNYKHGSYKEVRSIAICHLSAGHRSLSHKSSSHDSWNKQRHQNVTATAHDVSAGRRPGRAWSRNSRIPRRRCRGFDVRPQVERPQ